MNKKIHLLFICLFSYIISNACPMCEKQQPKLLRGITHGTGPQSNWDFVIITGMVVIVVATLFFSIKWLIKPGEKSAAHIKHLILNFQ